MTGRTFVQGLANWLQEGHARYLDLGVEPEEVRVAGGRFMEGLRRGNPPVRADRLSESDIELLRSAWQRIVSGSDISERLRDGELFFQFISGAAWPEPEFEERAELLWECALAMWSSARSRGDSRLADVWLKRLAVVFESLGPIREAFLLNLEQYGKSDGNRESLVAACLWMVTHMERAPSEVLSVAGCLYEELDANPSWELVEEEIRYFKGETALRAGVACRILGKRQEARVWFHRAARGFEDGCLASADCARLLYQELALAIEERRFEFVSERLGPLTDSFRRLGMPEDRLKCRFLAGAILKETSQFEDALQLFLSIRREALALGAEKLLVGADASLIQLYAALGDPSSALQTSHEALPIVRRLGDRVALGKLQWGIGDLFREQGRLPAAIEAYRSAQIEFREIGLRTDRAALHLVIGDLLLDMNRDAEARSEIAAALPVIEEEKMVPEGVAAVALLRQSLHDAPIDRQALRKLAGTFRGPR